MYAVSKFDSSCSIPKVCLAIKIELKRYFLPFFWLLHSLIFAKIFKGVLLNTTLLYDIKTTGYHCIISLENKFYLTDEKKRF